MNCNISKKDYIAKLDNTSSLFKRVVNRFKRHLNNNKLRITGKSTGGQSCLDFKRLYRRYPKDIFFRQQ